MDDETMENATVDNLEPETSPLMDFVNNISVGELNKANGNFNDLIADKMADALDAQRIAVAQNIFGEPQEAELSDEDIEDIVDEVLEDDEEILAALEDDHEETELDGEVTDETDAVTDEVEDEVEENVEEEDA
jgi:hypothetical protein